MIDYKKPHIIDFNKIGASDIGYITVTESKKFPFVINRLFWTYYTPESIVRGRHAHFSTEQVLIAISGRIIVTTELADGEINIFVLEKPNEGIYLPPNVWHTMQYSHNAVQLVLASHEYDSNDYIRDYSIFKKTWSKT